MLEVEVKVKIDPSETAAGLEALGFSKGTAVYEYDTYFNGSALDLKNEDKALRIREHRDLGSGETKYILNFKGPKIDDVSMTREETQFEVPSFKAGETVLNGLNFYAAGHVEKTRTHYQKDNITCCLDHVSGLGDFLEIEIMAEEDGYDTALERISGLLQDLGTDFTHTVRKSYLGMLQDLS